MTEQRSAQSQDADGRLSTFLARWADAHRLSRQHVDAIRQSVVSEPAPSDFDWWWRLLDPESGTAFQVLQRSSIRRLEAPSLSPPAMPQTVWTPAQASIAAWTQDADDFQPYLRLT